MSTDGDDPSNKDDPASTLAGFAPPAERPRHGLPPPNRSYQSTPPTGPTFPPPGSAASPGAPGPHQTSPAFPPPPTPPPAHAASGPHAARQSGAPQAQLVQSESSPIEKVVDVIEEAPGRFVGFLKISARRAFRLRIEPTEILPDERQTLAAANPPVHESNLQAFLAWRRSVLFLVATILVPLALIGIIDSFTGTKIAPAVRFVKLFPALAETLFCVICWLALRQWANWRRQRRWLFWGWLLFMLTPFVVFVYPLRSAFEGLSRSLTLQQMQELGYHGAYNKLIAPFAFSMLALLQLAPKVISLMPGLIRSSLVIKLLFPGASAPGWLIVFAAPLYAMITYSILIIPYQFSANEWFIFGVLLIVGGQILVARSGFALAKPLTEEETLKHIRRVRVFYMVLMLVALISITAGLGLLVKLMNMKWSLVVTTLLKFEANVLILTIIGADLVVTNLDRARGYTEGKEAIEAETERKIAAFVGLNAPTTPPPPGPAPSAPMDAVPSSPVGAGPPRGPTP